jgi:hypothetical protein
VSNDLSHIYIYIYIYFSIYLYRYIILYYYFRLCIGLAGDVQDRLAEAGMVALSFLRAHAPWLHEQYDLEIDPRRRFGMDYVLSFNDGGGCTGSSGGAAYAGRRR